MKKETKEKLKKFLKDRKLAIDPKDIALIILEKEKKISPKEWQKLESSLSYFLLDNTFEFRNLVDEIIKSQKKDKILLIEIKADPSNWVIQLFKEISHFGSFNIHDKKGKLVDSIKIKPGLIIVIAERSFIEKKISYPGFYNIFNTALII